jgi:hypothetical protein
MLTGATTEAKRSRTSLARSGRSDEMPARRSPNDGPLSVLVSALRLLGENRSVSSSCHVLRVHDQSRRSDGLAPTVWSVDVELVALRVRHRHRVMINALLKEDANHRGT